MANPSGFVPGESAGDQSTVDSDRSESRTPDAKTPPPRRKVPPSDAPLDGPKPWRTEGLPPDNDEPAPQQKPGGFRPSGWRFWAVWLALLVGMFAISQWISNRDAPPDISYNEFSAQVLAGNVAEIHAKGDTIDGELRTEQPIPDDEDNKTYTKFIAERPTWAQDDLWQLLQDHDVKVSATPVYEETPLWMSLLGSILPWVILIGAYFWLMNRLTKGGGIGGLNPMQKDVKPIARDKVRVNFDDVAGIDEVKDQVLEIVDYLRYPEKYARVGAHAPKGVLLEGAPGTGKTLLARATAGEAEVPFFSASASEFIEMIVGVGAQRVRQLFDEARKAAPSIVFVDEIDAIGRSRGSSRSMGGNDEREQTLNQILTEMDGFDGTEGVVVMAATNRSDVLDAALTRPGRFDRVITVNSPDLDGRVQIMKVHTRKIPMAKDVNLREVGSATPGMTGADLANLANEAALLAAKRSDTLVYQRDFMNALEKIQLGVARSVLIPDDERRRTAYHESGHALLGMLQKGADPVRKVSIIPRGQALGVTLSTPDTDKYGFDKDYLEGRIVGALGGMAAEQVIFGIVTTGAESDLRAATSIARQMVGKWGMSEKVGPMQVLSDQVDPRTMGIAESTLNLVDDEVRRIIGECMERAIQLLQDNRDKLEAIVAALLEHETLDEAQVYEAAGIVRPKAPEMVKPQVPTPEVKPGEPKPLTDAPWAPPDPDQ